MEVIRSSVMGFCFGVKNVFSILEKVRNTHPNASIYTYGKIVHNSHVVSQLEDLGIHAISSPEEVEKPGILIIRAHGIADADRIAFKKKGFTIYDATCPLVALNQRIIRSSLTPVLIVGKRGHAEVVAAAGCAKKPCFILEKSEDVATLDPGLSYTGLVQTTFSSSVFQAIKEELALRGMKVDFRNDICQASIKRRKALVAMCPKVDAIVVVGDPLSANSRELCELARSKGKPTFFIEDGEEVCEECKKYCKIGLTAGASTPQSLIDSVLKRLEG